MRLQTSDFLQAPDLKLIVDELSETLRREAVERQRFRETLSEDVRAEFINGRVVVQVSTRIEHFVAVKHLMKLLDTHVFARKLGFAISEQALTVFTRNDYSPDVCFWKKAKSKNSVRGQTTFPVPDFVCEVLSPSTAATDRGIKLQDYEAHGVSEYWIIDPERETIEQYVLKDGGYEPVGRFSTGSFGVAPFGVSKYPSARFSTRPRITLA